jgi:hypothetical protein
MGLGALPFGKLKKKVNTGYGRVQILYALSQNYEKGLLASPCLSVSPSILMEQLGSHWTAFRNI